MQEESQIHQNQPTPATSFKLKNFIQLSTSVNPKKSLFELGLFLSLLTSGASLIVPQLTKKLVDTSGTPTFSSNMVIVLIVAFALQLGLGTIGGFLLRYVGESAVKTLRERLWTHLLHLPVGYFD